jgi:hypothetical protein
LEGYLRFKICKTPGVEKIPAELLQAGDNKYVLTLMHLLILFEIIKKCLSSGRGQSMYLFRGRFIKRVNYQGP